MRISSHSVSRNTARRGIAHQASPALQNEVTLSALNNPFAEATESVNRHGLETCEKRVRTLSEHVGQAALNHRAVELEQFPKGLLPQGDTFAGQRVVIALDGGRTCMRLPKQGRKKKGQKYHKEILPFCDGTHEGREQFKLLLKMYLHKTGAALAKHITFIGDGALWIWNIVDEIIKELNIDPQKVTQVLDYYHACENFWKVIDALPKPTQKKKQRLLKKVKKTIPRTH